MSDPIQVTVGNGGGGGVRKAAAPGSQRKWPLSGMPTPDSLAEMCRQGLITENLVGTTSMRLKLQPEEAEAAWAVATACGLPPDPVHLLLSVEAQEFPGQYGPAGMTFALNGMPPRGIVMVTYDQNPPMSGGCRVFAVPPAAGGGRFRQLAPDGGEAEGVMDALRRMLTARNSR